MKKTFDAFKTFLIVTIPTLIILFIMLEVLSRLFFPGSLFPGTRFDEDNLLLKLDRQKGETGMFTAGKFAQQRGKWRINNDGWNSLTDYSEKRNKDLTRIAIIGDSYVEAVQVDFDKRFPSILGEQLRNEYEVYSFGISSAPFSQYLNMARYVEKKFDPDIYIINLVHNDFDQSITGLFDNTYVFLTMQIENDSVISEVSPSPPKQKGPGMSLLYNLINKSSFLRYLYFNIKITQLFQNVPNPDLVEMNIVTSYIENNKDEILKISDYIMGCFKRELGNKRIIFIMDAPRIHIYENNIENSKVVVLNQITNRLCSKYQIESIDLTPFMTADYQKNKTRFESKWDYHWNEYGHEFVAKTLYEYLNNN